VEESLVVARFRFLALLANSKRCLDSARHDKLANAQSTFRIFQSLVSAGPERPVCARLRIAAKGGRDGHGRSLQKLVMDWNNRTGLAAYLAGDSLYHPRPHDLAVRPEIHSSLSRVSFVPGCRRSGSDKLLAHSQGGNFSAAMVRHRVGYYRTGHRRQTGRSPGGALMTLWSLVLIVVWLVTFVAGQLFFKRAMELSSATGFRNRKIISILSAGLFSMTISFFLNLGLLQRFDLSYLYPFQGLSVIIISLMAAVILKEKLTLQLAIGALLISAGVALVSLS